MESTSTLSRVPSRKALRKGQQHIVEKALEMRRGVLPVQLPTGYGKTLAACATYAALREAGVVNRLLYLVSTDSQRRQFIQDSREDFADAGLPGIDAFDLTQRPDLALKEHRRDKTQVFAATIQAVASGNLYQAVCDLFQTGRWMVVVDEYHHYGMERKWGRTVRNLNFEFLLAMSATPDRRDGDGAFGVPAVRVPYLTAFEEDAVKKLVLHAYEYRVDAIAVNGQVLSFTTTDLCEEVGSDDPCAIDRFVTSRKLRWSPKYISPLVSYPLDRLVTRRAQTHLPLQMIVGAMGCQHARMVCEQIRSIALVYGELRVDWVGTGEHGRSDEENRAVLKKFCPPKRLIDGVAVRRPEEIELDILVHVGMAGEGLDAVYVTEVVHLNPANITNQNDQENGRASRWMPGLDLSEQVAYINVDSGSAYAKWDGTKVMQLFDVDDPRTEPPDQEPLSSDEWEPGEYRELPDEPQVFIAHCELTHIYKGDPEVRQWALVAGQTGNFDALAVLDDESHPQHEAFVARMIALRRQELLDRAKGMDRMSQLAQLQNDLNVAVGKVAYLAVRVTVQGRFEKSLIGDMKRRLSSTMLRTFGAPVGDADEDGLRRRYAWLKSVESTLRNGEVPVWLA